MRGVIDAVAKAVPFSSPETYTVACIRTSNPTFLLFAEDSEYPEYVVKFGESAAMGVAYQNQSELESLLPEYIANPILLHEHSDNQTMFVQQGLVGEPWFVITPRIQSEQQWRDLGRRLTNVLQQFHQSVGSQDKWRRPMLMGAELLNKAQEYARLPEQLPQGWDDVIQDNSLVLDELGTLDCVFQHGDYCVNNILCNGEQVGVIDFEFFGKTLMPLHDEFSLMHSLVCFVPSQFQSESLSTSVWTEVLESNGFSNQFQDKHVKALYLHFLIWWAIETHGLVLRKEWAQSCRHALEQFCQLHQQQSDWYSVTEWQAPGTK